VVAAGVLTAVEMLGELGSKPDSLESLLAEAEELQAQLAAAGAGARAAGDAAERARLRAALSANGYVLFPEEVLRGGLQTDTPPASAVVDQAREAMTELLARAELLDARMDRLARSGEEALDQRLRTLRTDVAERAAELGVRPPAEPL
jgi:hypothetical protein